MQTYKFDPNTREFLYAEEAFLDPLETAQFVPKKAPETDEEGNEIPAPDDRLDRLDEATQKVYLLPVDSTWTEPLAPKSGYAVCWNGTDWVYIEDHRQTRDKGGVIVESSGTPYWMPGDDWQTPARNMKELGKLPEGAMLTKPEKPQEVVAQEELQAAKAERAAAVAAITVEVDGMVFDGDEAAQERMARAVLMADSLDEETEWVLADSTVAVVTAAQLRRACRAAGKTQTELWVVPYQS